MDNHNVLSFSNSSPIDKYYKNIMVVGEGAFGVVRKAERLYSKGNNSNYYSSSTTSISSKYVAIKQMKTTQRSGVGIPLDAYREIKLLKELTHDNIVSLEHVFLNYHCNKTSDSSLYLVYSYAEHDLSEIIRYHRKKQKPFQERVIKSLLWQILNGVKFLHENWIMHRDIKPANILIMGSNSNEHGCVKIADFGLARIFQGLHEVRQLAADGDVVTIWYRAPELLLSSSHYTPAIDIWAIGCIFAEMILGTPIFMGQEEKTRRKGDRIPFQASQLRCIINILGKPTPQDWPLIIECPFYDRIKDWAPERNNLSKRFQQNGGISNEAYDLLSRMLLYDPAKRITATDALKHPYFNRVLPLPNYKNAFEITPDNIVKYLPRQGKPITSHNNTNTNSSIKLSSTKRMKLSHQ